MKRGLALICALVMLISSGCAVGGDEPTEGIADVPTTTTDTQPQSTAPSPTAPQTTEPLETAPAATEPQNTQPQTTVPQASTPQSTAPQTEDPPTEEAVCTLVISCETALDSELLPDETRELLPGDGVILRIENAVIEPGDTVFSLLQRECKANKVHMEFVKAAGLGSAYVEGIGNLYELDCGELSGWLFTVNGEWSAGGCSLYELSPGDYVEWLYTCDLGRDVGAPGAGIGG